MINKVEVLLCGIKERVFRVQFGGRVLRRTRPARRGSKVKSEVNFTTIHFSEKKKKRKCQNLHLGLQIQIQTQVLVPSGTMIRNTTMTLRPLDTKALRL